MIDALQLLWYIMVRAFILGWGFVIALTITAIVVDFFQSTEDHSQLFKTLHEDERDRMVKDPPVPHEPGVGVEDVYKNIDDRRN